MLRPLPITALRLAIAFVLATALAAPTIGDDAPATLLSYDRNQATADAASDNPLRPASPDDVEPAIAAHAPDAHPLPMPQYHPDSATASDAYQVQQVEQAAPPASPAFAPPAAPPTGDRYGMLVTPVAGETVLDEDYDLAEVTSTPAPAPKVVAPAADVKSLPPSPAEVVPVSPPASLSAKQSESPADVIARRLAPPSTASPSPRPTEAKSEWLGKIARPSWLGATAGIGLAVVVGLLLVCTLMMRRGSGKSSGVLPAEAFAILGRAPLVGQSYAQLIRVGNKLVLVAMTPSGPQPLTEVTDPVEVGRLIGLCSSSPAHGPSAEFQQVLASLAREPTRGFLGGEAKPAGRRSA